MFARKGIAQRGVESAVSARAMLDWIPADIRRASLRGQIHTELSLQRFQNVAQEKESAVEDLKKSEDLDPCFNLNIVRVDESGQFNIGYFELLPPSSMD